MLPSRQRGSNTGGKSDDPRPSLGLALAAILVLAPGGALAQDYPARQIHFLQGFAPGGNADAIARVLGEELSKAVGQPVVGSCAPAPAEIWRPMRPPRRRPTTAPCC